MIAKLSNRVSQINVQTRFITNGNTWPPEQPKMFTPLLLIHHQDYCTPEQMSLMAELMYTGDIGKAASVIDNRSIVKPEQLGDTTEPGAKEESGDHGLTYSSMYSTLDLHISESFSSQHLRQITPFISPSWSPSVKPLNLDNHKKAQRALDNSAVTKEIKIILAPLKNSEGSCFVLIEGAPGIGKSVLLKEIAYRWGKKQLLQNFKLVLLVFLRDPYLEQIISVNDLLELFCRGDKNASKIADDCSDYLFANNGKGLIILLDGYDEYPRNLQKHSLIADILKCRVLPLCGLIVSPRPHASEHFRQQATVRVDILGFTETKREHYIKQALPDQLQKVEKLTQYLHQQPSIDSICFIPFNTVVLLYL